MRRIHLCFVGRYQVIGLIVLCVLCVRAWATQTPYGGSPWDLPGQIEAEEYDEGGDGIAYSDETTGNAGGVYRTDDVDIYGSAGTYYAVGYTEADEWLEYTVDVDHEGWYNFTANVACQYGGRYFHIEADGEDVTGQIDVPNTGGGESYDTISIPNVSLSAGEQVLRIDLGNGVFNIDWISASACSQWPYGMTAWAIPGTIQAEDYDEGGETCGYHDVSSGNSGGVYRSDDVDIYGSVATTCSVGYTESGEWLEYTVDVDHDGWYDLDAFVATPHTSLNFDIEMDGESITSQMAVPNTGSYDTFQSVGVDGIALEAGLHQMRVDLGTGSFSIDKVVFTARTQWPYGLTAWAVPGRIEAEDYDEGGNNVAYYDTTTGNNGTVYRSDDVDITAADGGYVVYTMGMNEWLEYTIDVDHDGWYDITARLACAYDAKYLKLQIDGEDVTGIVNVPNTGSSSTYQTMSIDAIALDAGAHTMRIALGPGGFRLNWIEFAACAQWPYGLTPWPIPGQIEAEDYDEGGANVAYYDTSTGNSGGVYRSDDVDLYSSPADYALGNVVTNEWVEYTVNVDHDGLYDMDIRVATPYSNRTLHVECDGDNVSGSISLPNTGAYDTYQTVRVDDVELEAGQHVLRLALDSGEMCIDWIKFTAPASPTLSVSASDTVIAPGDTVNFSLTVSGGTTPYTYAWDFDTPPNDAVVGAWDHNKQALAYSTSEDPSHTFVYAGVYDVWVTVADAAGMKARAFLRIDCSDGANVLDAVDDVGLDKTGTDNEDDLATYLNALSGSNKRPKVVFPAGTYRFSKLNQFVDGSPTEYDYVWLEGEPDATVTILFDPPNKNDSTEDILFKGSFYGSWTVPLILRNVTIKYDLDQGDEPKDVDPSRLHKSGDQHYVILQNTTVRNFSNCLSSSRASAYRSNLLDWQGQYDANWPSAGRSSAVYGSQNMMLRDNYLKSRFANHSHLIYSSGDRDYVYYVGNWGDQTDAYPGAVGYRHQGSGDNAVRYRYCFRNVAKNVPGYPFYIGGGDTTGNRARDVEVIDNVIDSSGMLYLLDTEPSVGANVRFNYNHIQNQTDIGMRFGSGSTVPIDDVDLVGNVFGWNAPMGTYWDFVSSSCSGSDETAINPSGTWLDSVGGNVDNRTLVDTSDPGEWEFVRPSVGSFQIDGGNATTTSTSVTLNSSVTDAGSGMGSSPRWPYLEGALMQFSNDGTTWSEVRPYGATSAWTLSAGAGTKTVHARFRDVDGNWSEPVSDTITLQ